MSKSRGINLPKHRWTDAEDEKLRDLYPRQKTAALAALMGMRESQVYQRANSLGLKKTPEYLASPDACRLRRGDNVGAAFRFKSGQEVWNKGEHFSAGGRSPETRFKLGQSPHNTKPIGSYRLDKDGTLQRKISNNKGNNSQRWRGVHELVWAETNGPVPAKHIVVFRPRQRTNVLEEITLDKVECLSFSENMKRNTVHNLPKELAVLVQLTGALNRKINGKQRSSTE